MDDELNIEISTIISLANGDPQSLLPNLFSSCPSPEKSSSAPEVLHKEPSQPATKHAAPSDTLEPLRKKLKLNNFVPLPKNSRKYLGMKSQEIRFRIQGDKVIEFCQEYGLIAKEVICRCGKQMRLTRNNSGDGFIWMCRHMTESRAKQSIRKGTWFEKSKLKIADILWIAYMWVYEYSYTSMLHECDQSSATLAEWCQHCIDVCQAALECKAEQLGGEDKSVEIFEGTFKKDKHRKSNGDNDRWAFCGLEQYSSKSLLLIIDDKESQSVMEIFDKYFLPGTTIVSPVWCALKHVSFEDFKYLTEERSISFYDQVEKSPMEDFKEFKRAANRPPPGKNKWSRLEYGPQFFEKMHRKSLAYAPDAFLAFLKDVSLVYKPCDRYIKRELAV